MNYISTGSNLFTMNTHHEISNTHLAADPILLLMKEHEEGLQHLKKLDEAAERMRTDGFSFDAFEDVVRTTRFMDTEFRRHKEKEEKYLFPLMARHVNGSLDEMHDEHRALWRALNSLRECVKDLEEMKIYSTTVRDLVQYSRSFAELWTHHITKENTILFPAALRILTHEEYRQLTNEISAATDPAVLKKFTNIS